MELGKIAYEAYYEYSHGFNLISGAELPSWENQAIKIQEAWTAAANAVATATVIGLSEGTTGL
jgi:hypothetical protein